MHGDSIIIEAYHRKAATGISERVAPLIEAAPGKHAITVAGESGSGKSEIASALAELLEGSGLSTVILQQDDYFIYPPKTNDRTRRQDIDWVGPQEVRLDLMDRHLQAFLDGQATIEKPLVIYADDRITSEVLAVAKTRVAIADGTYTTLLSNAKTHVFIDRDFKDTKKHRERRNRDQSELDSFIDRVLSIEHRIISPHKSQASIVVNKDYSVSQGHAS